MTRLAVILAAVLPLITATPADAPSRPCLCERSQPYP